MKQKILPILFVILIVAGLAWSQQRPAATAATKWEYWTILLSPDSAMVWLGALDDKTPIPKESSITEMCNLAGQHGWELVAVDHAGNPKDTMFYFKRPAP